VEKKFILAHTAYEDGTERSETSAQISDAGESPKRKKHSQHDESLKSGFYFCLKACCQGLLSH